MHLSNNFYPEFYPDYRLEKQTPSQRPISSERGKSRVMEDGHSRPGRPIIVIWVCRIVELAAQ